MHTCVAAYTALISDTNVQIEVYSFYLAVRCKHMCACGVRARACVNH